MEIPYALSLLGHRSLDAFVPGMNELVYGDKEQGILGASERMESGKKAVSALKDYQEAKRLQDSRAMEESLLILKENMQNFGYGHLKKPEDIVPPVALTFYSFHIMVALGSWFVVLFVVVLYLSMANDIERFRLWLWLCLLSIPLGYIAAEAGWIVAEVGRQPWAIQDLMPVGIAATNLSSVNVKISFVLFAVLFTALLVAEVKIMLQQIRIGFEGGRQGGKHV